MADLQMHARRWPPPAAVVAAVELVTLQQLTLPAPEHAGPALVALGLLTRLVLALALFTWLLRALRAPFVVGLFVVQYVFSVAAYSYYLYFHHPWSALVTARLVDEAIRLTPTFADIAHRGALACFGLALALKLGLLLRSRPAAPRAPAGLRRGVILAAGLVGVAVAGPRAVVAADALRQSGFSLGYAVPWVVEALHASQELLLARAEQLAALEVPPLPGQAPIPLGDRVVVVQAESLDLRVMGLSYEGTEVTPFLNRLRRSSLYFELDAVHHNGSADADFAFLMARRPSSDTLNYLLEGFDYTGALPRRLAEAGWRVEAVHGVSGDFFSRRPAYEAMGFTELLFAEELQGLGRDEAYGMGLVDRVVLAEALERVRGAEGPTLQFLITFSSHTPFTFLPPDAPRVVEDPRRLEPKFLNAIHYLDRVLGRFIEGLPRGTTVVIYGDHAVPAESILPPSDRERIPAFVHRVGDDLSPLQTRPADAPDADLVHFASWVHRCLQEAVAR